jgi:hypothetical protein
VADLILTEFEGVFGNGSTDCTVGVNNAVATAIRENRHLFVPAGTYRLRPELLTIPIGGDYLDYAFYEHNPANVPPGGDPNNVSKAITAVRLAPYSASKKALTVKGERGSRFICQEVDLAWNDNQRPPGLRHVMFGTGQHTADVVTSSQLSGVVFRDLTFLFDRTLPNAPIQTRPMRWHSSASMMSSFRTAIFSMETTTPYRASRRSASGCWPGTASR